MKLRLLLIILLIIVLAGAGFVVVKRYKLFKPAPPPLVDRTAIRIEIINCSGIDKQGNRTQDFLRSVGFDVYEVRSGKRILDKTTIIERIDPNLKNASAVRDAMVYLKKNRYLPIVTKKIYPETQKDLDSLLYLDVTVILGKDCDKFLPKIQILF